MLQPKEKIKLNDDVEILIYREKTDEVEPFITRYIAIDECERQLAFALKSGDEFTSISATPDFQASGLFIKFAEKIKIPKDQIIFTSIELAASQANIALKEHAERTKNSHVRNISENADHLIKSKTDDPKENTKKLIETIRNTLKNKKPANYDPAEAKDLSDEIRHKYFLSKYFKEPIGASKDKYDRAVDNQSYVRNEKIRDKKFEQDHDLSPEALGFVKDKIKEHGHQDILNSYESGEINTRQLADKLEDMNFKGLSAILRSKKDDDFKVLSHAEDAHDAFDLGERSEKYEDERQGALDAKYLATRSSWDLHTRLDDKKTSEGNRSTPINALLYLHNNGLENSITANNIRSYITNSKNREKYLDFSNSLIDHYRDQEKKYMDTNSDIYNKEYESKNPGFHKKVAEGYQKGAQALSKLVNDIGLDKKPFSPQIVKKSYSFLKKSRLAKNTSIGLDSSKVERFNPFGRQASAPTPPPSPPTPPPASSPAATGGVGLSPSKVASFNAFGKSEGLEKDDKPHKPNSPEDTAHDISEGSISMKNGKERLSNGGVKKMLEHLRQRKNSSWDRSEKNKEAGMEKSSDPKEYIAEEKRKLRQEKENYNDKVDRKIDSLKEDHHKNNQQPSLEEKVRKRYGLSKAKGDDAPTIDYSKFKPNPPKNDDNAPVLDYSKMKNEANPPKWKQKFEENTKERHKKLLQSTKGLIKSLRKSKKGWEPFMDD